MVLSLVQKWPILGHFPAKINIAPKPSPYVKITRLLGMIDDNDAIFI
jgi:hypothetical protein